VASVQLRRPCRGHTVTQSVRSDCTAVVPPVLASTRYMELTARSVSQAKRVYGRFLPASSKRCGTTILPGASAVNAVWHTNLARCIRCHGPSAALLSWPGCRRRVV
jgi:hypothetical protein